MGQLGFFDADRRLAALSEKGDPLEAITALVPWESFRAEIEAVVLTPDEAKKSKAGRKPFDAIMMFRMLVLQSLYNLSDVQIEYQVWDRATFTRFVGLGSEDCIPDGTTLWLFREKLARAGLIETLFDRFDQHLTAKGYIARGGQMVDASIVPMPKQRNTREENEAVKRGETPAEWERKPAKNRQKDKDARWTKKHGRSFFGYKNHVNVDRTHKLIRRYAVTDAAVHDSRKLNGLLHQGNTSHDVFGDSAYRSAANEATLKGRGFRSRIHVRGARPSAVEGSSGSEPGEEPHPRAYRACVRRPGDRAGRPAVAHHRHRAGADQDRLAELRLQRSLAGDARTQEVSLVQIGEPTGCRLRAEPARPPERPTHPLARSHRIRRLAVLNPGDAEIRACLNIRVRLRDG